jgi:protein SCO1/2
MRLSTRARASVLACAALVAAACTSGSAGESGALRGVELPQPWPRPDFTLTATNGRRFDFLKETSGRVTLLFFGYTHCPDVCPVHLANLAAVLRKLPPPVAREVTVVFVSTDPARDTPERIRAWLDQFDPRFIGLRGSLDSVNAIQRRIGLAAAVVPDDTARGSYTVGHAAQVVAYTRDDVAHVVYPFGTRQADWAHDLPKLIAGRGGSR